MRSPDTTGFVERLRTVYGAAADPVRAAAMSAYMRDRFPYLGIPTPERRALSRRVVSGTPTASEAVLADVARRCWELEEREYQYFACDLLVKRADTLTAAFVPTLRALVTAKSWWDTIDPLATRVAGPMVRAHPELVAVMDEWIGAEDMWLVRVALLHQMHYGEATDTERLRAYCTRQAGHPDFFVRKAIGWALRQYAKTDADAVRAFVARTELSPLSRREALKNVGAGTD